MHPGYPAASRGGRLDASDIATGLCSAWPRVCAAVQVLVGGLGTDVALLLSRVSRFRCR